MQVLFHKSFVKAYKKLPRAVQKQVDKRILLFLHNADDGRLRAHALRGQYEGRWSIDVTGDYRAVYEWLTEDVVRFLDINTHSELYG